MADDLDTAGAVRDFLGGDTAQRARASVTAAQGFSPDVEADLRRISDITGVPISSARANPDIARRRAVAAQDFDEMAARFPSTMGFLADPENAKLAHDDMGALSGLETVMRETAWAAKQMAAGIPALGQGTYGVLQAGVEMVAPLLDPLAGTVLPANPLRGVAAEMGKARRELAGAGKDIAGPLPADAGIVRRGISSGLQSVGGQAPGILASVVTGNPTFALASAGVTTGGQSFGEARDKGVPTLSALIYGGSDAAVEIGTEMIPMARLLGDLKAGSGLMKTLVRQATAEVPGELAATTLQEFNKWATLNPDAPFTEYARSLPQALAETLIATLVGVGVQTGAARGAARVAGTLGRREADGQDVESLARIMAAAGESKLRDRDPTAFAALVQKTAEDAKAPAEVYLDARAVSEALQQSGVTPEQFTAALPSAGAQLADALAIGGDIVVPVGEFAAGISGSALEQALMQHVRTSAEALSKAEAALLGDSEQVLRAAADRMAQQGDQQQADTASRDAVRATVLEELNKAGRFTPDVNAAYAEMTARFFEQTARRVGLSAEALYQRYPLKVRAATTAGENLQQKQDTRDLLIQHNLSAENLLHAQRMGGIAVPSLAVTKADAPLTRAFGEITLLGGPEMVDPKGYAGTKVFGADIYSPRYPKVDFKFDKAAIKKINAALKPFRAEGQSEVYGSEISDAENLRYRDDFKAWAANRHSTEAKALTWDQINESVQALVRDSGATEQIFQGFTYSGNRRYVPHTLDNVVKILKKELRGGESFNYGVGSLRAKFTPQFRSIDQVRKAKDRLIDAKAFEKVKREIDDEFWNAARAIDKDLSSDTAIAIMEDAARIGVARAAKSYGYELTQENAQVVAEFLTRLRNLPTEYFEAKILRAVDVAEFKAAVVPDNTPQAALDALAERGVNRVATYKAGDEADRAAKIGQFNDLFFQTNQRQNDQVRGTFSPSTNTIALLARADLSTFLHESGHFYLEVLADLASQENAPPEIVEDMGKVLKWFGLNDDGDGPNSVERWRMMTLEEQRPYHEQFARGFEAYLFEGRAPSVSMGRIFDRFKTWMLGVYKAIKNLGVEINDDVRGVFDRLLASEDEILQAQESRRMEALFKDAKDAGMSDAEWRTYQALGADATAAAVQALQQRSVRDMKWLSRARDRKIRELQQEAADLRRQVRAEARAEVMQQPLYRAWKFLTGRAAPEDTANAGPKDKASKSADPTRDSLLVAMAKLGGISRESAMRDLGVPEDSLKAESGVFGAPVFRKKGGMSADDMLQTLTELGYMHRLDEFGRSSLAEFETAVAQEIGGDPVYSIAYDYGRGERRGEPIPENAIAGKLDTGILRERYGTGPEAKWRRLSGMRMTSEANGLDPDVVAEAFGFSSGDEMIEAILVGQPPGVAVDALTDQRMLERHGDLTDQQAIERAADEALHNDARAKFLATELAALDRAVGKPRTLMAAARQIAADLIGRKLVKDVRVGQFTAAEVRAAREAAGTKDVATRAAAKRNQLLNHYSAREAGRALDEIDKGVDYLRKFERDGVRSGLDPDYVDQIDALLERFDLRRSTTGKDIARRQSLAKWLAAQEEMGLEPDIPPALLETVDRRSYKELTVSEFRGLVDTVRQIEHLGRLKNKLLTAKDRREFDAVREEMLASIEANGRGRTANTRSANTRAGQWWERVKAFGAAHIKAATWARVMDGGKDGGPMWEYLIRNANEAGDKETRMRADATRDLTALVAPLLKTGSLSGDKRFFPSINRSLNREARIAIALNWGNESNRQRLLGGEGWQVGQVEPVLRSLTPAEWQFVQAAWDYFESYRPQIAEKERRVYGREPEWIEASPFDLEAADGTIVRLRGGYYPVRFDPRASERAESHSEAEEAKQMMRAVYTAATTRRSFTKTRAEQVKGRPLLYGLDGIYTGINEVIHDLSWHEFLIDANRIVKDKAIAGAIRSTYGPDVHAQFKTWLRDVAVGDKPAQNAGESALSWLRQGVSVAGLGLNIMSAAMQPLGITQSIVRVGAPWIGRGIAKSIAAPLATSREIGEMSSFMATRFQTQMREINELRNQVRGQSKARRAIDASAYAFMLWAQRTVDVPTWWGAYEKALAEGNTDERAVGLADQAVIDAQGSGMAKDLSAIERGSPALKLFTTFYSFFNTTLNNAVARTMTEESKVRLAADYLLLLVVPAVLGAFIKDALTPGDAGDDDPEKLAKKLAAAQLSYLMGLMFGVRELGFVANQVAGEPFGQDYTGPAGLRMLQDVAKVGQQIGQGEADDGLRKAIVNLAGDLLRLPAAQINRTITGTQALVEGKTDNPAAVLLGYQEPR